MSDRPAPTVTPEFGDALAEFRELQAYGRESPQIGEALSEFLDKGAPPFRAYVDMTVTIPATNLNVRYELTDGLKVLLTAGRAWHRQVNEVPMC